jgi:hydrogenase nickel incorporation protein HypB
MCENCGCGTGDDYSVHDGRHRDDWHAHHHADGSTHWHSHAHAHGMAGDAGHGTAVGTNIQVERPVLEANDRLAEQNRGYLRAMGIVALNLVSSPGAGKTTLLRRTLESLRDQLRAGVIVGDLETDADAEALRPAGAPVVQITTGTVCHLDARMVASGMERLPLHDLELLFIENVGNLVCPASFDLGESRRVVLLSATEGENKPLKYPPIFHRADLVLITKMDLASATGFDAAAARENVLRVHPGAHLIELSARTGEGMEAWLEWVRAGVPRGTSVA